MLVVSPQLLGGVFPWSIAVICVLAGIAGILGSRHIEIFSSRRGAASFLDWMMVIALAWTCVQLIPLPSSWVALLVPESADAWQSNALLYGRAPRSWIPMSLDPGATRLEIAKGTAIVAIFVTARLFAASHQRRRVLAAVAASAITMALVAFGHKLAGASAVFGIYEPVYASTRLLAPLMNENHLGGFMALAAPIALGLALDADTLEHRAGWMLGAGLCALAGILSFSRGGILALAIGVTIFAVVYAVRLGHSRRSFLRSRTLPILTVGALAIILIAVALDGSDLARELRQRHNIAPKFQAAVAALPLIASHPITGVGRGAFSAAFVHEQGTDKRFFQPENLLVQWTSEWGLPVALALFLIIIWSIGRGFRLRRSYAHLGGLAGLVAIGAQQFVDFSLELLGVAVVASATLGAVADSVRVPRGVSLRKLCFLVSCASLVGAALALSFHGRDVFTLEMRARAALEQDDHQEARELVRSGLWAHPSEPIFALIGAEVAVREGDPAAGRWINRAQALAPLWSAPHLLAARWLFSMGELDQALIEIREAEALRPGSARSTICSLLLDRQDPAIALRASPAGTSGAMFLDRAAPCVPLQSPVGIAIDEAARERDPNLPGPATRQARRLLADGRPLEAVDVLLGVPERGVEGQRLLAEAYLRADDPRSASHAIASLLNLKDTPGTVLRTAASVYVEMGDDANLRRVATRLRGQTGGKAVRLAEVESFLGKLYESHLRYALALKAYEDSNRAHESHEALIAIARVAETMGNRERALLTYRRLCRSDGGKGPACASADELAKPAGHWP
ncbi:MAG: O-antigen ligase family protein [Polyangiales bacterium]